MPPERWKLRSRSKTKTRRLFLALGSGTGAACSLEFLSLFAKAGFSVFPAIHESGLRWIAPEALRAVASHVPLSSEHAPSWIHTVEDFDLAIGIGLPLSFLINQTSQTDLFSDCFFRKSRTRAVLLNPDVALSDSTKQDLYSQAMSIQTLPYAVGPTLDTLRQTFSDILATFRRSCFAEKFSISIRRSVPESLQSLAGSPPAWHDQLVRLFQNTGFSLTETPADLVLETYEGPFVKTSARRSARISQPLSLTFSPDDDPLPAGTILNIRWMHPLATPAMIETRTNLGEIVVIRQATGDLLLFDRSTAPAAEKAARLIPNLPDRPAHNRLLDYLLDRLTNDEAKPETNQPQVDENKNRV